ncbi:uncharacterized protein PHALS_05306 [Plasmopara halstedii]|uniref:Uncharacterized protein n=1 Tax=Plasmopara halstedii TaxID=4781 RepID=A0A0P1AAU7_PLAHL|nr:uncharacterized protein PHALS_05306 [Plasmopara halstedii]CEG37525.1 hypothetical protein PHALS_05306 [Plasmopara halstedii]|eukprot:XP_024573894.1 hypothetical protein PHALS_05306 [Plasmopara halstedii]
MQCSLNNLSISRICAGSCAHAAFVAESSASKSQKHLVAKDLYTSSLFEQQNDLDTSMLSEINLLVATAGLTSQRCFSREHGVYMDHLRCLRGPTADGVFGNSTVCGFALFVV